MCAQGTQLMGITGHWRARQKAARRRDGELWDRDDRAECERKTVTELLAMRAALERSAVRDDVNLKIVRAQLGAVRRELRQRGGSDANGSR